jgi:hypothetical protein
MHRLITGQQAARVVQPWSPPLLLARGAPITMNVYTPLAERDPAEAARRDQQFREDNPLVETIEREMRAEHAGYLASREAAAAGIQNDTLQLADRVMVNLDTLFRSFKNHHPSEEQINALRWIARYLSGMATGDPWVYRLALSAVAPGVGKTSVLATFVRTLLADPAYDHVGVVIFANQKQELRRLVEACFGDPDHTRKDHEPFIAAAKAGQLFALRTSEPELDAIGVDRDEINEARVLFTTQVRLIQETRTNGGSFRAIREFHYRRPDGRLEPRQVRAWDETILPGRALVIKSDDPSDVRRIAERRLRNDRLAAALKQFSRAIEEATPDTLLVTPNWEEEFGVSMSDMMKYATRDQDLQEIIVSLWLMQGLPGVVRRDDYEKSQATLTYDENLAKDLMGPGEGCGMIVLDASGSVRETYKIWAKERDDLLILPSAEKTYRNLHVRLWNARGGRNAFKTQSDYLIAGIVEAIEAQPDQAADPETGEMKPVEWLIVHHKPGRGIPNVPAILRDRVKRPNRLHFVTYGRHAAINDYAHISNVILAGVMYLPEAVIEAYTRIVEASRPENQKTEPDGTLTKSALTRDVRLGEICHVILQAALRGSARNSDGSDCQHCDLYLIASAKSGVTYDLLHKTVFKESLVLHWRPDCDDQPVHAWDRLIAWATPRLQQVGDEAAFKDAQRDLGVASKGAFQARYRDSWQFRTWCLLMGIEEFGSNSERTARRRKIAERATSSRMRGWRKVRS